MCGTLLLAAAIIAGPDDALREFQNRVAAYIELHRTLEAHTPPRIVTRDVKKILAASDALADAIVAARPNARQGDIFTPAVTRIFRERIVVALADIDTDGYLADFYEGEDFRALRATIHGRDLQSRVPLGLPIELLWVLPELPSELEYRLVGRDLALWDEHAAMVVDFIPNAVPEQSFAFDTRGCDE
jgi:hypothetical protein